MALSQLTDEQIETWPRERKDAWWREHVYRGDMPQLTLRSALTGFLLGSLLSATALYIGAKTGIAIGVGMTSVITAFAVFRVLSQSGVARDITILENNCAQSIATAAGHMMVPLTSSMAAYMLVTGRIVPWWQLLVWCAVIAVLGMLIAFPMKRRFINDDQLPFPEGRASGVVLDALYTGESGAGMAKARLLAGAALLSAGYQFISSGGWMKLVQFKLLHMDRWAGLKSPWTFSQRLDDYYYGAAARLHLWTPTLGGIDVRQLGLRLTLDSALVGIGGLMGIRIASSVLLGTIVNYVILAPIMIHRGDIHAYTSPSGALVKISRGEIVNQWSLWWAVAMMVTGSLVGLLSRPALFVNAWRSLRGPGAAATRAADGLADIEFPPVLSFIGVPLCSILGAWVTHAFFGVPWLLAFVCLPLVFALAVICAHSMALTSWSPTGALAKITQFSVGAVDRANPASNLIPAGMTAEVAANAANILSDIKCGYMLGAKPRQQAIGHLIGILAGSLTAIPLFFLLFLPPGPGGVRSVSTLVSDQFAMPAALQWKGVADLITKGLHSLPASAVVAVAVAAAAAALIEGIGVATKGRLPLSAVSIGLGVVLPPEACLCMWLGALLFWVLGRRNAAPGTRGHAFWVQGCEPICAGLISGAALVGIGDAVVTVLLT